MSPTPAPLAQLSCARLAEVEVLVTDVDDTLTRHGKPAPGAHDRRPHPPGPHRGLLPLTGRWRATPPHYPEFPPRVATPAMVTRGTAIW